MLILQRIDTVNIVQAADASFPAANRHQDRLMKLARAIVLGGLVSGMLDASDGVVAFYFSFGFTPIHVFQYIAFGVMGVSAFNGGLLTAGIGVGIHFLFAFVAAAVYAVAATQIKAMGRNWISSGLLYGVGLWGFMKLCGLPLSAVGPAMLTLPILLNGIIGHALFVGLPIAFFSRRLADGAPSI